MKILLTGATGKLGRKIVTNLIDKEKISPNSLVVSVRNPQKAQDLAKQGIEVRQGDFDVAKSLDKAFEGIDRLLIISADGDNETRIRQHKTAVDAAARAGVKFIAYTSVGDAQNSKLGLAEVHKFTENAIKETGIAYSFLRNNWYLENELSSIQGVMANQAWLTSAGQGRVGWALQEDYAQAAAKVLAGPGYDNTIFELRGELLTQKELAESTGKVLQKEVEVNNVDDETYRNLMSKAGLPEGIVAMLVGIQQDIRAGYLETEANDFEKLLGRPATPIEEAIKRLID